MTLNKTGVKAPKGAHVIEAAPGGEPLDYKDLNQQIHDAINAGKRHIFLKDVCGQRFIGAALKGEDIKLDIDGCPGNDLAIFMDGPTITVYANAEDQIGNTMNAGTIVVHGHVGDVIGLSARGGKIFVKGRGGFRGGIHIKEYRRKKPSIVIGGTVKDYFGEYMAGGILIALGLDLSGPTPKESPELICGNCLASGIHNGKILLRTDELPTHLLGIGAKIAPFTEADKAEIQPLLEEFCAYFAIPSSAIWSKPFVKVVPESNRPFRGCYCAKII